MRRDAITACCQALKHGKVDWHLAMRKLEHVNGGECYRGLSRKNIISFLQTSYNKWQQGGGEKDAPRSGRPLKVPDSVALEAAKLVAKGTWYTAFRKRLATREPRGYTSIEEAVQQLQRLQQIKEQYRVDDKGLLHAMHRVMPRLKQHTVYFKYEFDNNALATRLQVASELLQTMPADEAERAAWLQRLVWMDEGGLATSDFVKKHVKVWALQGDTRLSRMVPAPHLQGQHESKVHFFMAVTAHPAFAATNGVVHWDFTTGTTHIRRRVNTLGQTHDEPHVYRVS